MSGLFQGTGVALITPFNAALEVDYSAYAKIVEFVISEDIDFIVPLGSTGEAATLTPEEQRQCLNVAIDVNNGRKPVLAGNFGGTNTAALLSKIKSYDLKGVDGILSASPSYVKPSQEGIFQHYMALAEASPLPIIIYNVPGRTKSNIEWSTTIRLAKASNKFAGIKEASGDLIQSTHILKHRPSHFTVSSGDDETALPFIASGGDGVISVVANAFPGIFSEMTRAARSGNRDRAQKLNNKIYDLHKWLYIEGNPVGIKSAMKVLGFCDNHVRLPLTSMTKEGYEKLEKCISEIKIS